MTINEVSEAKVSKMGLRYYCYIEELTEQGWSNFLLNDAKLAEIGLSNNSNNHPKLFLDTQSFYTFYSDPSYVAQFFLGEYALFNFTEGMPSDISERLKTRITNHTGFCWWIDFSNLMIDD